MNMAAAKTKGLGRGLSALFEEEVEITAKAEILDKGLTELPLSLIMANKEQPRRIFDDEEINQLAVSIKAKGLIQPILVRPSPENAGRYQIVAGERRYRAARISGLASVPVIIRDLTDTETFELAIVENIQRQDLTAIEEATAYKKLMDEFGYTQDAIAEKVGKSRSHIANLLRLLMLPDKVKTMIDKGELSMGHARALLSIEEPLDIAKKIVSEGWTVRDVENYAKGERKVSNPANSNDSKPKTSQPASIGDVAQIEEGLSKTLGLKVKVISKGSRGEVTIEFRNPTELGIILEKFGV